MIQTKSARYVSVRVMIGLLAACLFFSRPGWTADYFISPMGSDANSGRSADSPWRSLEQVNRVSFLAGDRILLQGGQVFVGGLLFAADDRGQAGAPITVGSYGTGQAIIRAGDESGVFLYNTAGFVIQDLKIVGGWSAASQSGNDGNGIDFFTDRTGASKLSYIRIENVDVSGFRGAGISIGAYPIDASKSGFRDVRVTQSLLHDNGDAGIVSWGFFNKDATGYAHENLYIGDCRTYNNQGITDVGKNSGNGIVLGDVDTAIIERCIAYNNGERSNFPGGGPVGIWAWDANNVTIQFNESYGNKSATIDGGGFDLDGGVTNSVMQYNYSHDNTGAGYLFAQFPGARPMHNNVARYNISQNDARKNDYGSIFFWNGGSGIRDCHAYNNTVFVAPSSSGSGMPRAARIDGDVTNVSLRNNIFMTTGGVPLVDAAGNHTDVFFQNNNYWSSGGAFAIRWDGVVYESLSDWRAGTGQEKINGADAGWSVDPQFLAPGTGTAINDADLLHTLSAYRLQNYSPLSNAGLDLLLLGLNPGGRDYYGSALPTGGSSDIGAMETANYLRNTGFETGSDAGWSHWWDGSLTSFSNVYVDAGYSHSGRYRITHWADRRYRQYTYQTVSNLPNGRYTLKVRLFSSGGQSWAGVGVKGYDAANPGADRSARTTGDSDFRQYTISNIVVTNNQCTVYIWSEAGANQWLLADDFELTPDR